MGQTVCHVLFVLGGQTICLSPGGQTFLTHRRGGDKHFSHTGERGGDKHFSHTFYVGGGGTYDDVVEELVVSGANFLVTEASKLSAGARIFRGL